MASSEDEDKKEFTLDIERIEDYKFKVKFDKESMDELITDESGDIGGEEGPNPSRLLAASTLNCLMASLTLCLEKRRVKIKSLEGKIRAKIERVKGRLRVTELDATIQPEIDTEDEEKLDKCKEIFENYCVVTQSVRNGIDVNVNLDMDREG